MLTIFDPDVHEAFQAKSEELAHEIKASAS